MVSFDQLFENIISYSESIDELTANMFDSYSVFHADFESALHYFLQNVN